MKTTNHILLLAATLMLTLMSSCNKQEKQTPNAVQLLGQMKQTSRIYTTEYDVSKVLIHKDSKGVKGSFWGMDVDVALPGTERTIGIPVEGVLKAYVDLKELTKDNIKMTDKGVEITLPDPRIELTATKINHMGIKEQTGIFRSKYNDNELTALQHELRDSLLSSVSSLGLMESARESATRTITALLVTAGFDADKIVVRFVTDEQTLRTPEHLRQLIDNSLEKINH